MARQKFVAHVYLSVNYDIVIEADDDEGVHDQLGEMSNVDILTKGTLVEGGNIRSVEVCTLDEGPTDDIAADVDRDNRAFDREAERERREGRDDRLPGD